MDILYNVDIVKDIWMSKILKIKIRSSQAELHYSTADWYFRAADINYSDPEIIKNGISKDDVNQGELSNMHILWGILNRW